MSINDIKPMEQYPTAVKSIKDAIFSSQYNAAKGVNGIQLSLYFCIGKYISENTRQKKWGSNALEVICGQLQKELPGLRGFSATNFRYMRLFYEAWSDLAVNSSATADELNPYLLISPLSSAMADDLNSKNTKENKNLSNSVISSAKADESDVDMNEFLSIGFSHHCEILSKAKSRKERLFYIHEACLHQWDKYSLRKFLKEDLYNHQGKLPNNFPSTIPDQNRAVKAINMFKDEYLLDFINVEEIGERDIQDIDERVVEKEIVHNIKKFIMTFGNDFSFVGNQYHLEAFSSDFYTDLLFFNRELNALVCIELKNGKFKPAYLGQLAAYLRILDDKVKKPHENPSIGIVLCKEADKELVQYVIQDYNKPMGVATYTTSAEMPEKLRKALPDIEDLKKLM